MPSTTRKSTSPATAVVPPAAATTEVPPEPVAADGPPVAPEVAPAVEGAGAPPPALEAAPPAEATGGPEPAPGDRTGSALVGLVTFPMRASQGLVRDVAVTARNPEAVAYWGGLAALALLGALEWPVAAAAGLGVAVAGAVRRGRG